MRPEGVSRLRLVSAVLVAYDLLLWNRRVTLCAEKTGRRSPALPQSLAILRPAGGELQGN